MVEEPLTIKNTDDGLKIDNYPGTIEITNAQRVVIRGARTLKVQGIKRFISLDRIERVEEVKPKRDQSIDKTIEEIDGNPDNQRNSHTRLDTTSANTIEDIEYNDPIEEIDGNELLDEDGYYTW